MRSYHGLAIWYLKQSRYSDAMLILKRLLSICPNDNLGCRYLIPMCLFELNSIDELIDHCKKHDNSRHPEISYSHVLALVMAKDNKNAKAHLVKAMKDFPLVASELLKAKHPKPKRYIDGCITVGGHDQAYEYWKSYGQYWESCDEAVLLLKQHMQI